MVQKGKILFDHPDEFTASVHRMEGKAVTVTVKRWRPQRSLNANALYWAYLKEITEALEGMWTRESQEAYHAYFKKQLLPPVRTVLKLPEGKVEMQRVKSTTELDKAEFAHYLKGIEMLTNIPIPNYD